MTAAPPESEGRYLFLLDILGFSELVNTKSTEDILHIIEKAFEPFNRWEDLNGDFKTIYFSDTFLFYQVPKGYGDWAFLDVYAIGSFVLTALLAEGIPARGAITFGSFEVHDSFSDKHQVYFGRALVEAHRAEQSENWVGITILPSAWRPFEAKNPGMVAQFENEKVWIKRQCDDVLLLNPFVKMRGWHTYDLIGEINKPYMEWDQPEFPNEIKAFRFLKSRADEFVTPKNTPDRVAEKYLKTDAFIKAVFGEDLYLWANKISS